MLPDNRGIKLRSSNQEASLSAGKNTEIVLVPYHTWKCTATAIHGGVDISKIPGFSIRLTKNTSRIGVS